jgi:hypothetical protein
MIKYFYDKSKKINNYKANEIRETIILECLNKTIPKQYLNDHKWKIFYNSLYKCFNEQYNINSQIYELYKIGGRQNNYDFILKIFNDSNKKEIKKEFKIEFKFNQSLFKMPQLCQLTLNKDYFINNVSYIEYYYENYFKDCMNKYLRKIKTDNNLIIIEKATYLKEVCQTNSKILKQYKEYYKLNDNFSKDCKINSNNSISNFLKNNKIDLSKFINIFKIQLEKDFLFYDMKKSTFIFSKFENTDFEINSEPIIKNKSMEYISKSNKKLEFRVCWKNGNGICNPAIKLAIKNNIKQKTKK